MLFLAHQTFLRSRASFRGPVQYMGWSHLRVQPNLPEPGCVKAVCRLIQGTFLPPLPSHSATVLSRLVGPKAKGNTAQEYWTQSRLPDDRALERPKEDCHWKDSLLYSEFPREGGAPCHGKGDGTWGSPRVGQEAEGERETVARDFTVVSMERNRWDGVSGLGLAS